MQRQTESENWVSVKQISEWVSLSSYKQEEKKKDIIDIIAKKNLSLTTLILFLAIAKLTTAEGIHWEN